MKVTKRGNKKLIIGGIYREQHLLKQPLPNTSDDPRLQVDRWRRQVKEWVDLSENADCVVLGDMKS